MSEFAEVWKELARIKHALERTIVEGTVAKVDAKKQLARLKIGEDEDGQPILSPWVPYSQKAGKLKQHEPVSEGQQMTVFAPMGDMRRAMLFPTTFSDDNPSPSEKEDENVRTYGETRHEIRAKDTLDKVGKVLVAKKAEGKLSASTGDVPGDDPNGGAAMARAAAPSGGAFPHELNRQLAGLRAGVTQNAHAIAGLHDATSKLRQIAQMRIPELATLIPLLNSDAASLKKATDGITGKLESYLASAFQDMVGKLTNSFLGGLAGLVSGNLTGQVLGLLDQVPGLAAAHGIADQVAPLLDRAKGLAGDAVNGASGGLESAIDEIGEAFAGTEGADAFGALRSQLSGMLSMAGGVMGGIGSLVDGQENLTKGLTKSLHLGGY